MDCLSWVLLLLLVAVVKGSSDLLEPDRVPVFVKPYLSKRVFFLAPEKRLTVLSPKAVSVIDVCNSNPPCYDSLGTAKNCHAVTSSCNCLVWAGIVNRQLTNITYTVLKSSRRSCVRLAVSGNGTLVVDWFLRKVGLAVPSIKLNAGFVLWRRSSVGRKLTFNEFMRRIIVPKLCNKLDIGPTCMSRSSMHLTQLPLEFPSDVNVSYAIAAGLMLCAFVVADIIFSDAKQSVSQDKKNM